MGFLPLAWREQLAWERRPAYLLDGETLDAAHGFGLLDRRLRWPRLVVDIRPGAVARRKKKKRWQECTECVGAEDTVVEDGQPHGIRAG